MSGNRKRLVVTGRQGQIVCALLERGAAAHPGFEVVALGRPELDLSMPDRIEAALLQSGANLIVSAAAYTAVDQAEEEQDVATLVNGVAPGKIAAAAKVLDIPIIHLSTDYVFDGTKSAPYVEDDPVLPGNSYGHSKLLGENSVAMATPNHVILRTSWVYSPFGRNFVKTMLRLAESRDRLDVVNDQIGNPTSALDAADAIFTIAERLMTSNAADLRGIFHMAGSGETDWAGFAARIFEQSAQRGGPVAQVRPIPSSAYPTPARRPANSRLDCRKLAQRYGIQLPDWRQSCASVVTRLLESA